jgi:ech hydrogenase subunit D
MKRIDSTLQDLKGEIGAFYKYDKHHFIVMNAVDLGQKIEVQWFFSDYEHPYEVTAFCIQVEPTEIVPSMKDIVSSAWVAEAELVDLIDINIENTEKGFVLEADSEYAPLRKKK